MQGTNHLCLDVSQVWFSHKRRKEKKDQEEAAVARDTAQQHQDESQQGQQQHLSADSGQRANKEHGTFQPQEPGATSDHRALVKTAEAQVNSSKTLHPAIAARLVSHIQTHTGVLFLYLPHPCPRVFSSFYCIERRIIGLSQWARNFARYLAPKFERRHWYCLCQHFLEMWQQSCVQQEVRSPFLPAV